MRIFFQTAFIALGGVFFLLGCGRCGEKDADVVVVQVGDERLTQKDLESFVDLRMRMMDEARQAKDGHRARMRRRLAQIRLSLFPGARLLVHEAKRRGLKYEEADYTRRCGRFARFPEDLRRTAVALVEEDLTIGALRKAILSQTPVRDNAFLAGRLKAIDACNARAERTNALSRVFLADLRREIGSGKVSFEEAARQHSQDDWIKESGPEWGTFKLSDLADDVEVHDALRAMKKGDIAGPLSGDNGLMLLRLDEISDGGYRLSRIFRRLMAEYEKESADQLRTRFHEEDGEACLKELARRLLAEHPPVYPNGTNVLDKISNKGEKE